MEAMSESPTKILPNNSVQSEATEMIEPSRDVLVDWGVLLSLIADDLDKSIKELKELRHEILDVRQEHFPSVKPFQAPKKDGLERVADQLQSLESGVTRVVDRFRPFRAFRKVVRNAIDDREDSDFDLD
jgi:hypothetical protein